MLSFRRLPSPLVFALLLALPLAAQAGPADQSTYNNARYGYAITYPAALLTPQGESDAGDGQIFRSPDGRAELRVFAWHNVLNESLDTVFSQALDTPGLRPTYQRKRKDWFVVSGYLEGNVLYQKTILKNETYFTLRLLYAAGAKATYDPIVGQLVRDFVVF